ncbi:MAG: hypothetical protein IKY83_11435 [Proteobacteria bacterium]|nr:hypothetical protein [Pseudomonadota bacterium]
MDNLNYWLIEMNAKVWNIADAKLGDRQTMDSRRTNSDGSVGALVPLLGEMKVGELILVFEAAPVSHIARILVVTNEREQITDDEPKKIVYRDLVFKVVADIPAVTLDALREKMPDLHKRIASAAAIHKLSAEEFQGVLKLAYAG